MLKKTYTLTINYIASKYCFIFIPSLESYYITRIFKQRNINQHNIIICNNNNIKRVIYQFLQIYYIYHIDITI